MLDISDLRKDFTDHAPLRRQALNPCPILQFQIWLEQAMASGMPEPNAMVLSTCFADGKLSQRTVLLKQIDETGFIFFSNYQSQKALAMAENAQVSLLFPWFSLQRQVIITGKAEKVSRKISETYFANRPHGSQLSAWASKQSQSIASKAQLQQQWQETATRFTQGAVPLPDFWGGYRVIPSRIEFWQGQPSRLHDRFLYSLLKKEETSRAIQPDTHWIIQRLQP